MQAAVTVTSATVLTRGAQSPRELRAPSLKCVLEASIYNVDIILGFFDPLPPLCPQNLPSFGVKEGLSCEIFRAIVARKKPNLALPSLQHSVYCLSANLLHFLTLLCGRHVWKPPQLQALPPPLSINAQALCQAIII